MKKLFNRTKRPEQEWENYDESEYEWDDASYDETASEEEAYYEEETFAETGEYDNEYYAESDPEGEYEEAYESDEPYYEDAAEAFEATEFYEASESYVTDEQEGYAGESNDLNYSDQGYDADSAPSGGRSAERQSGKKAGFMTWSERRLSHTGLMDRLILGTGVAVLIMAVITGGVYINFSIRREQVSSFASVGSQLDQIDMIGGAGLLAVADAQIAKQAAADIVGGSQEDPVDGYQEEAYRREVQVVMEFVSIQKDLKIKFVNEKTNKLVANVPFSVTVTDPDGKTYIWSDDDMDGIIYKKDITPGNYKVAMEALADERYANYSVSTLSRTAEVKKNIAYEKVEVANEIKSEDEVDASKEDTKQNETQVESVLKDTVAWVESSVIKAVYSEVDKNSITDPMKLALSKSFMRATGNTASGNDSTTSGNETTSGGDAGNKLAKGTISLDNPKVSVVQGGTVYVQVTPNGFTKDKELTYSIAQGNTIASVDIDNTGKITVKGISDGTANFEVTVDYKEKGDDNTAATATLTVNVTAPKTLTLDQTAATAYIGEPLTIKATVPDVTAPTIKAVSQDESIATVTVNQTTLTVDGKKAGVVNITVSLVENNVETTSVTCVVTVKENPKTDKVSALKDKSGNQLYVLDNGEYREAKYADFYVENNKFYVRTEERYTGWQTINGKVYYFTAQGEKVTGEQVIQGARYQFASDGSLVQGTGALGIDVSKWNGKIDWNAVKKSGINYVIIRCGYRGSSAGSLIEDPMFVTNIKGATAAGLKVGVYFFTQAMDEREAVEEASMVLELVKNYTISYPVFLDVESSGGRADTIDKATRTAVCKAFCQTIKNAGYTAGIYANKSWLDNKIDASALSAYKIWLAQYAATPTYTGRYDLWQYRSTGTVGGISGNVDMNLSYLGY